EGSDPLDLEMIDETSHRGMDVGLVRHREETAHRVGDHDARAKSRDHAVHLREMHLETVQRRARSVILQEATVDPLLEVDPDRPHVADDLRGRLLEQELEASLPAPARGVHEMRGDARLAGTGGARDEDGAAPEIARALE